MEPKSRAGTVQDSVYINLRKSIINLNLAPGTAISEQEIALRYKVSRTPVRETFIHLAKEGLIQVFPQRETLVSRIDFSRVEQEFFLRESLEMAVLEPFIEKGRPEDFITLEGLIQKQNAAFENNDYIHFVDLDDDFHRMFFETAGQDLSWAVLANMCGHYHRIRLLTIRLRGTAKNILGQHKKLLGALKKKESGKAREILREHLHKLGAEEKMLREEFPGYFVSPGDTDTFDVDFGGLSF
ncbi:MAG: GntR family transcriptional regulator [Treponema sp.]|jgi:DNA-binding GntR family transcriptional regulator|nr:GntR family transcriptional regulator [Treponema sp.]